MQIGGLAEPDEVIMNWGVIYLARKKKTKRNFSISCNFIASSKYSWVRGGVVFALRSGGDNYYTDFEKSEFFTPHSTRQNNTGNEHVGACTPGTV